MKPSKIGSPLPKSQLDFESLNRLDEAGFVRLSLAVAGIFCASQKWHTIAIYRQKSAAFREMTLEKAFSHGPSAAAFQV